MRIHKIIPLMATLVALTATAPTYAQKGERFGMIGIARTQTSRLNIVATEPDVGDLPPCRVQLQFRDGRGALIKMSDVSLESGHSAFLDLAPDGGDRHQIRATWQTPDGPDMPQCVRAKFIATVEVFDKDGKTTVLYPGSSAGIDNPNL